jgi:hypothetical protein
VLGNLRPKIGWGVRHDGFIHRDRPVGAGSGLELRVVGPETSLKIGL